MLVISDVDYLLVNMPDDRWLTSVSCLVSFVVLCTHALECTCARLWLPHVIAVTCATVCASVVVAAGLAGPWTPLPLGGSLSIFLHARFTAWLQATYLIYVWIILS